jgi:pimeloyl-ACP methyl ester carboxylesterase
MTERTRPPDKRRAIEWVDGPAGRLRVDDGGKGGIPVLFVHGLAGDRTVWENQLPHLRATRRAIAMDLRGHGESALAADGSYGIPGLVSDVAVVAKALDLDRFVLVGHSVGAAVAAGYAGASPERVAGLLLVDPSGDATKVPRGEAEAMLRQMEPEHYARFVRRYYSALLEGAGPEVRDHVMRSLRLTRREVVEGTFRASLSWNPVPSVDRFPGPKLAVVAELNRAPWSLTVLLPSLGVRTLAPASHWVMMDRKDEFNRILDEFLAEVR